MYVRQVLSYYGNILLCARVVWKHGGSRAQSCYNFFIGLLFIIDFSGHLFFEYVVNLSNVDLKMCCKHGAHIITFSSPMGYLI